MSCRNNTMTNMEPGLACPVIIIGSYNKSGQLRIVVGYKGLQRRVLCVGSSKIQKVFPGGSL
jgi:hypothetical protein